MKAFVISDIHGDYEQFKSLIQQIELKPTDKLFLLGDYIDRGPDSKEVLDHIMLMIDEGYDVTCLKGNHEAMLLEALENPEARYAWMKNGGDETLSSFLTSSIYRIPEKYVNFIENLPHYAEYEQFVLVHAGLNMQAEDPFSDFNSMLWLRNWKEKFNPEWLGERMVIHGHTPNTFSFLKSEENLSGPVVNIDNGTFRKAYADYGKLCALELNTMQLCVLE